MSDHLNYHCRYPACGRALPRRTAYCPYCGTAQSLPVLLEKPGLIPQPVTVSPALLAPIPTAAPTPAPTPEPAPTSAPTPALESVPEPTPASAPSLPDVGSPSHKPPKPPRLGIWLRWTMVIGIIVFVWNLVSKPQSESTGRKADAVAVAVLACELKLAGQRMQELRTLLPNDSEQYRDLQAQLKAAKPACEKKLERKRDWERTLMLVNSALEDPKFDKALYDKMLARLLWFKTTWKDDGKAVRDLGKRLDAHYAMHLLESAARCLEKAMPDFRCVKQRLDQWERLRQTTGQELAQQLREQLGEQLRVQNEAAAAAAAARRKPQGRPNSGR